MKKIILMCVLTLFCIIPAHAQTDNPVITPENAPNMIQLAQFGDGDVGISSDLIYAPTADTFAISSSLGAWVYDASAPDVAPFLLDGHTSSVYRIAYSSDGQFLASAGFDGLVHIWHIPTRSIIQTFLGEWVAYNIYFTPDGQSIIIHNSQISDSLEIYRASIETGQVQAYNFGNVNIYNLALHPSDNTVAISFHEPTGQLSLWTLDDTPQQQIIFELPPNNTEKWQIAFSADGSRLIGAGELGTIAIWDVHTAELITWYRGNEELFAAKIIPSPDGASFLTFNTVPAWARTTAIHIAQWALSGELMDTFEVVELAWDKVDAVYTDDTIRVITADSQNNRISGWDWSSDEETAYLAKNWYDISDMSLAPDGETLAIAIGQSVRLLSADTLIQTGGIYSTDSASAVAYAPDGRTIATLGREHVSIWDVQTGELLHQIYTSSRNQNLAYNHDGTHLLTVPAYMNGESSQLQIWDAQTTALVKRIITDGQPTDVAYLPDGRLVMSSWARRDVSIWNPATPNTLIQKSFHDATLYDMVWHPATESLVIAFSDDTLRAWHPASDTTRMLLDFADDDRFDTLFELAYHPTLDIWAGSDPNYQIILFHLQNPQSAWLYTLTGHRATIRDLVFSPDGSRLYSASSDGTVRMWGVPNS
jgi:WD40 repeat protein